MRGKRKKGRKVGKVNRKKEKKNRQTNREREKEASKHASMHASKQLSKQARRRTSRKECGKNKRIGVKKVKSNRQKARINLGGTQARIQARKQVSVGDVTETKAKFFFLSNKA